jgi:hypothetical protein
MTSVVPIKPIESYGLQPLRDGSDRKIEFFRSLFSQNTSGRNFARPDNTSTRRLGLDQNASGRDFSRADKLNKMCGL